jgi:hypothetical protein
VPDATASDGPMSSRDRPRQWAAPQRGQGSCRSDPDTLAAWAPVGSEWTAATVVATAMAACSAEFAPR